MKRLSLMLAAIILVASMAQAIDVPYLTGRVTDNAQILAAETRRSLTESLKAHESRTGNQIAILTIPTLDGESIEEYAVTVFNEWKLGQKGKDNGILIVIVPNDRRMRIEVGYGLESTVPDALAGRIIQHVMTPKFKNGDFNGGIADGARALVEVLEGGKLPAAAVGEGSSAKKSKSIDLDEPDLSLAARILIGTFVFSIIGMFTVMGIVTPGAGWFLYLFLIPFWAMFPIIIFGTRGALICLISYVTIFPTVKLAVRNTDWYKKARRDLRKKGKASIGGFTFGSRSSSGSSSSGGSSFSGGGGSSGGGGASGSW